VAHIVADERLGHAELAVALEPGFQARVSGLTRL
jgi:hypothetical protein